MARKQLPYLRNLHPAHFVGVEVEQPQAAKKINVYSFQELLRGNTYKRDEKGNSRQVKIEGFKSFEEAFNYCKSHNLGWNEIYDAFQTFHSGCKVPRNILEEYHPFYQHKLVIGKVEIIPPAK